MKEKINASAIPDAYLLCLNQDCPKATGCLRRIAEQQISDKVRLWRVISPKPATAPISALPASRLMHSVSSECWSGCPTGKCKKLPAGS